MKKRMMVVVDYLLLSLHNHCAIIAFIITLIGACGLDTPYFWLWMSLWSVPVYLYITRTSVAKILPFFILQLLPVAIVFFIKVPVWLRLMILFLVVFYVISSIKVRFEEIPTELSIPPLLSIVLIGGTYIAEDFLLNYDWDFYYLLMAFVCIVSYIFHLFLEQYMSFVYVNKNTASNIPEKEMFVSGLKQTIAYVACGITIMLLTINVEWLPFLLSILGRGVRVVVRFLFSFVNLETPVETEIMKPEQSGMNGGMGFLPQGEAHPFWILLEKIAMIAFWIGLAVVIVKGMIKGYRYLRSHFRKLEYSHNPIQSGPDIRESCEIEHTDGERLRWFSFLNNTEKVRKMYRKRVLKHKDLIVGETLSKDLEYLTAKECCDKISADVLKEIYEKARYSSESITADDVRSVKASMK